MQKWLSFARICAWLAKRFEANITSGRAGYLQILGLEVWLDAVQGKQDYMKYPGDWFIVHTVIPEVMSPPMSLLWMSELRRGTRLTSK